MELLVVERNIAVPVRPRAPTSSGRPAEIEAPDVVDDVVDELIEAVALRRGEVVIVPDGRPRRVGTGRGGPAVLSRSPPSAGMRCSFPADGGTLGMMSSSTALLLLT